MSYGMMVTADMFSSEELIVIAQRAEQIGITNLWVPELFGRDPFITCSTLLGATRTIHVGTAIANVYARDARATKASAFSLAEAYGNRFELGLGVSNKVGNDQRGLPWQAPVQKLKTFMSYYENSPLMFQQSGDVPVFLAAHGPKLMQFAAQHLQGAYVYLKPIEYSRWAKDQLGSKKLHLMQVTVFESEPSKARAIARKAISIYMPLENYHRAWREAGFKDDDFQDGGSDEFIDSLIAWGDEEKIKQRYTSQIEHGVDQIIISAANLDFRSETSWDQLASLIAA